MTKPNHKIKKLTNELLFQDIHDRTIFVCDNLNVMRKMADKTVDLIYLDPPFGNMLTWNAKNRSKIEEIKNYFLELQKNQKKFLDEDFEQIFQNVKFDDTWKETDVNVSWQLELLEKNEKLYHYIDEIDFVISGGKYYLFYMAIRLLEMQRILKDTGSIYLHCDNTMGHYLKGIMDIIFGYKNFRNDIMWKRYTGSKVRNRYPYSYGNSKDFLLFYGKSSIHKINRAQISVPYKDFKKKFHLKDKKGFYYKRSAFNPPGLDSRPNQCYFYKGIYPPYLSGWVVTKFRLSQMDKDGELIIINKSTAYIKQRPGLGIMPTDMWSDIVPSQGNEKTGYPTQKPLALLERIIRASSDEGDIVLDPFCGCATTLIAAENLGRRWLGIDKNRQAFYMNYWRMRNELSTIKTTTEKKETTLFGEIIAPQKESYQVDQILFQALQKPRTSLPKRSDEQEDTALEAKILRDERLDEEYRLQQEESANVLKGKEKAEYRRLLKEKQRGRCKICKAKLYDSFHLDRILPGSKGGKYTIDNLQVLCINCNLSKNQKSNIEFVRQLLAEEKIDIDIYKINVEREFTEKRISDSEYRAEVNLIENFGLKKTNKNQL